MTSIEDYQIIYRKRLIAKVKIVLNVLLCVLIILASSLFAAVLGFGTLFVTLILNEGLVSYQYASLVSYSLSAFLGWFFITYFQNAFWGEEMTIKYIQELERKKAEIDEALNKEKNVHIDKSGDLKFFEFGQNNSGGSFHVNDKVCHKVIIEAHSYSEARQKAMNIGIYFDGCSLGLDCSCCGDRWNDYNSEPMEIPKEPYEARVYLDKDKAKAERKWQSKYGKYKIAEAPHWEERGFLTNYTGKIILTEFFEYLQFLANEHGWTSPDIRVYFYDGTVKEIFKESNK